MGAGCPTAMAYLAYLVRKFDAEGTKLTADKRKLTQRGLGIQRKGARPRKDAKLGRGKFGRKKAQEVQKESARRADPMTLR